MIHILEMRNQFFISACLATAWCAGTVSAEVKFPGKAPGKAQVECSGTVATLSNKMFSASFRKAGAGVVFDGLKLANGKQVAGKGTNLFVISLADGKSYKSSELSSSELKEIKLPVDKKHPQLAQRYPGKAVSCTFTTPDKALEIKWQAVLRDGSHYLRQEMAVTAMTDTAFSRLTPVLYNIHMGGTPELSGYTTHGKVVVNDLIFCGLETPMSLMSAPGGSAESVGGGWDAEKWSAGNFSAVFNVPATAEQKYGNAYAGKEGPVVLGLNAAEGPVSFAKGGSCKVNIGGGLNVIAVQLFPNGSEVVASEDVHKATEGSEYTLDVPEPGDYTLKIWVDTRSRKISGEGTITYSLPLKAAAAEETAGDASLVQGDWERKTTLAKGQTWEVSSVLGFFAPEQRRRSFLAYSERERAAAYRVFAHYNDWYEIGITINGKQNPRERNSEKWQLEMLETWKREMIQKRKTPIDCFVVDDGWDEFNSLWDFHVGFPNGFAKMDRVARSMKSGIGTWLGPVGGYGAAKSMRLGSWNKKHPNNQISNFQLSNQEYFKAFVGRCTQMVRDYDMRYFKFDGISTHFHSKGPGNLEDAEGIIRVLTELRKARPDIYLNTTVGTWASPFWFHYSDCVWRQENDFDQFRAADGPAREKWITYRDRLVYNVYVRDTPLFPMNSVMIHGIIITKNLPQPHRQQVSNKPEDCLNDVRAATGLGSSLMELYVDRDLMAQENGRLWDELAACIRWARRNEDVLPDIHWVGGSPWDDTHGGGVYGWASWMPGKCTLTLRNSSASAKTLTSTLRQILDIPPAVKSDKVKFSSSFKGQREIPVLMGKGVDIDKEITIEMQPLEVVVLEGVCGGGSDSKADDDDDANDDSGKKKKNKKGKKKGKKKKKKSRK